MNRHDLYIATGNAGKLQAFATAAATYKDAWRILPLPRLAEIAAPSEDGLTFEENARAKALYYAARAPGAIVLADDSGLEVDALGGAPGVYSARFAERSGCTEGASVTTDEHNNRCLLRKLAPFAGGSERIAQYRCVLAAARDGTVLATAEGFVRGEITARPRGDGGFGYDPFFLLPHLHKTMAELDAETCLRLSHRGAALRQLLPQLAHFAVAG